MNPLIDIPSSFGVISQNETPVYLLFAAALPPARRHKLSPLEPFRRADEHKRDITCRRAKPALLSAARSAPTSVH
jgi:hypothetical protein